MPSSRLTLARLREALARPTDALPLDIFRVLVGALVFAYFLRTFIEAGDFSGTDGLIDHALSRDIFWFTRLGLFQSGMSLAAFQTIFLIACLCSWALILGYRVKLFAALLYVIAVSTYRWNFLVMYVDDVSFIDALLVALLPLGRTLILGEWRKERWRSLAPLETRDRTGRRAALLSVEPCSYLSGRGPLEVDEPDVARRHRALCRLQNAHLLCAGLLGAGALLPPQGPQLLRTRS